MSTKNAKTSRPTFHASSLCNCNMSKMSLNPLHLPEIIPLVGDFLYEKDLLNCVRVSKTFHNAFIGLLYRRITVEPSSRYPSGEALQKHKKHIEEILFQNVFPEEYTILQGCARLQSINYWSQFRMSAESSHLRSLSNLIRVHGSTITRICFHRVRSSHELWKALLGCTNLNRLGTYNTSIRCANKEFDLFLQVCKKVRHLELVHILMLQLPDFFRNSEGSEYVLPNIRILHIEDVQIVGPPFPYTIWYYLGMLVRKCPGLCELTVDGEFEQNHQADFYRAALLQHPWILNSLSDLCLLNMTIEDEDMAALLRRITELNRLISRYCKFGQLSLQELLAGEQEVLDSGQMVRKTRVRRLCETVEALAFRTDNSGITQAILSNCPRLRTMEGSKITVTEIVNGAEWVSTELTSLVLDLEADVDQETEEGMAKARIAFRQLGRLTQLNSLAIAAGCQPNGRRTLDLRLRTGLDELANLKSLKVLMFGYGYLQRIELQDAVWIVDNWPSMRYLYGRLEVPMGVDTSVYDFLKSHNISIS